MTEQPKKLSRRDAIKLIGAATGASLLASLPTKWTKPEVTAGVLPAHAQTSSSQPSQASLPTVTTDNIVDEDGASVDMDFYGTVVSDGGSPVTARGFVWSTSPGPTLPINDVPSGSGTGAFSSIKVATTGDTTIYLRSYATNSVGTAYGSEMNAYHFGGWLMEKDRRHRLHRQTCGLEFRRRPLRRRAAVVDQEERDHK